MHSSAAIELLHVVELLITNPSFTINHHIVVSSQRDSTIQVTHCIKLLLKCCPFQLQPSWRSRVYKQPTPNARKLFYTVQLYLKNASHANTIYATLIHIFDASNPLIASCIKLFKLIERTEAKQGKVKLNANLTERLNTDERSTSQARQ